MGWVKIQIGYKRTSGPATTTYRHYEVCAILYHVTSQLTLRAASLVRALTTVTSSTSGWPKLISISYREFKTVQHVTLFVMCRVDSNIQPIYCVSYTGCQCAVESTLNWLRSVTKRTSFSSHPILPISCRHTSSRMTYDPQDWTCRLPKHHQPLSAPGGFRVQHQPYGTLHPSQFVPLTLLPALDPD